MHGIRDWREIKIYVYINIHMFNAYYTETTIIKIILNFVINSKKIILLMILTNQKKKKL